MGRLAFARFAREMVGMSNIYEVAKKAGVSVATVSRVLGQPNLVRRSTRDRVLAVIEELEYEPNRAAQTLRTFKAAKILVTVPDISNPFFSAIIRGAEETARDAGYSVVLGDARHDQELENQYAAMLRRGEVDGLIFLGHRIPDILQKKIADSQTPYPVVNGCEFSPDLPVSSVHIDNRKAGVEVMEYLYSIGHRRIGIIGGPPVGPLSRDRLAGVRQVAMARDLEIEIAEGDFSVESGFLAAKQLIPLGLTALFCFSDEMAIGAFAAIRSLNLQCPRDVSVVGFDDIRFARYAAPTLTTISQPTHEIGEKTVQILLQLIRGELSRPISLTLAHELIVRESSGNPP